MITITLKLASFRNFLYVWTIVCYPEDKSSTGQNQDLKLAMLVLWGQWWETNTENWYQKIISFGTGWWEETALEIWDTEVLGCPNYSSMVYFSWNSEEKANTNVDRQDYGQEFSDGLLH